IADDNHVSGLDAPLHDRCHGKLFRVETAGSPLEFHHWSRNSRLFDNSPLRSKIAEEDSDTSFRFHRIIKRTDNRLINVFDTLCKLKRGETENRRIVLDL